MWKNDGSDTQYVYKKIGYFFFVGFVRFSSRKQEMREPQCFFAEHDNKNYLEILTNIEPWRESRYHL